MSDSKKIWIVFIAVFVLCLPSIIACAPQTICDLSATDTYAYNIFAGDDIYSVTTYNDSLVYLVDYTSPKLASYNINTNSFSLLTSSFASNIINIKVVNSTHIYYGGVNGVFGKYKIPTNTMTDLSTTDAGDWLGSNLIRVVSADSQNLIYIGAVGTSTDIKFGRYNASSNIMVDLSATDTGGWWGTYKDIYNIVVLNSTEAVYICGDNGNFGIYNKTSNILSSLTAADTGNWVGTSQLQGLAKDTSGNLYIGGASGKFGIYTPANNTLHDLSATDAGNWLGTTGINRVEIYNNKVYVFGLNKIGVYNPSTNILTDLSATDAGNWFSSLAVRDTAVTGSKVFMSLGSGFFGYYDTVTNVTTDLSTTDKGLTSNWISTTSLFSVAETSTLVYIGLQAGKFGVYNKSTNITYDLSTTDTGNWVSSQTVRSIVIANATEAVYIGAGGGKFGRYNATSNVLTDLSATDTADWLGTSIIYATALANASEAIYIGCQTGKFGRYNATSNVLTDLSATDTADWLGTSIIYSITVANATEAVYISAAGGKFGRYNATSNVLTDLSATDTADWLGTDNIRSITFSNTSKSVYIGTELGKFGVYTPLNNTLHDLSTTDTGNWLATSSIYSIISNDISNSIYLGIAAGKFGVYTPLNNTLHDLSTTDIGNWLGTTDIYAMSGSNSIYIGAGTGKFGFYKAPAEAPPSNVAPTIISKTSTAITLTSNATTNFNAWFIANDHDGVATLNDTTSIAYAVKSTVNISSSSCTPSDINTTATNYSCTLAFPFYSEAGSWSFTVKAKDTSGSQASSTGSLTVNQLDSISYSNAAVWTSLSTGSNNNEASPITFKNLGNGVYNTIQWTGYDTQYSSYKIRAGNYSMELTTSSCPGTQAINGTAVTLSSASLNRGASATEIVYPCVNVPNGIQAGTYTSVSNWIFAFS
jgi:hypothetical protein